MSEKDINGSFGAAISAGFGTLAKGVKNCSYLQGRIPVSGHFGRLARNRMPHEITVYLQCNERKS
jgi:hypothetical protein